uniref:Alliinase n=1 Tax=Allium lenkoranicum TaxID=2490629 RepID=A0A3G8G7X7_9ASPA|nr:alliinase [Allium lenkoranicum]
MESFHKVGSNKMPCLLILTCIIMSSFVNNNIVQAKVTWSLKAAEEAEAVANINCSGHGRAFLDGILSDGSPKCECNTCYTGADCSQKITGCSADVASGDGLFLEEYWKQHKENSAVLVSGWHRTSYFFNPVSNFISFELEKTIKELHEIVGNAAAKDRYIVFGVGVTQLIHGLVISLSPNMTATPCAPQSKVVAHAPYYPVFREQTKYFHKKGYEWKGNAADYVNTSTPEQFIGWLLHLITPKVCFAMKLSRDANPSTIWFTTGLITPQSSTKPMKISCCLQCLNTLDTLVVDLGGRCKRMNLCIITCCLHDKEHRGHFSCNTTTIAQSSKRSCSNGENAERHHACPQHIWFSETKGEMGKYHCTARSIRQILLSRASTKRILQLLQKNETSKSPSYAWVKCEWEEDKDCYQTFQNGRINTQSGEGFEAGSRYVRLSLIKTKDALDQIMYYLKDMVEAKRKTPLIKQLSNAQTDPASFI